MKKVILHLCADLGSDSRYYQLSDDYEVIMVGEKIGVENYEPPEHVHGIIANPVCTEFSTAKGFHKDNDIKKGMLLVKHCIRIISDSKPTWWVIENPANGRLKDILGKPQAIYSNLKHLDYLKWIMLDYCGRELSEDTLGRIEALIMTDGGGE